MKLKINPPVWSRVFPWLAGALALSMLLVFFEVQPSSSAGNILRAAAVTGELPLADPEAELWQAAEAVLVPLSGQSITLPGGTIGARSVTVRALHNEQDVAFLLSWPDDRPDTSIPGTETFRDGVALEFPLTEAKLPFFCMGQSEGGVNIWHWKADWSGAVKNDSSKQAALQRYADWYPAQTDDWRDFLPGLAAGNILAQPPGEKMAENLVAAGFGSLTTTSSQDVKSYGVWQDGQWHVIFSRHLQPAGEGTELRVGRPSAVALAVWDGAKQNRGSRKSTSTWITMEITPNSAGQARRNSATVWGTGLAGLMVIALSYSGFARNSKTNVVGKNVAGKNDKSF